MQTCKCLHRGLSSICTCLSLGRGEGGKIRALLDSFIRWRFTFSLFCKASEPYLVCHVVPFQSQEILTLRLFAACHFGSRLFATFANGHVYDFAPGVTLSYELCIEPRMYPVVARRIGEMHLAMRQMVRCESPVFLRCYN